MPYVRGHRATRLAARFAAALAGAVLVIVGALILLAPAGASADKAHASDPDGDALAHTAIVGGEDAEEGQFPSLAFIYYRLEPKSQDSRYAMCTGTVVTPTIVLTAAHCAEELDEEADETLTPLPPTTHEAASYTVVTGATNWYTGKTEVSKVEHVVVYPGFEKAALDGDAALLTLTEPVAAPAATLAGTPAIAALGAGMPAQIVGWGETSVSGHGSTTKELQWAETEVQSVGACEHDLFATGFIFDPKGELCALSHSKTTGACHGDSGGPLLTEGAGGPIEVGVTSHAFENPRARETCSTQYPTIFTRTDILLPWIEATEQGREYHPPEPPVEPPAEPTKPIEPPVTDTVESHSAVLDTPPPVTQEPIVSEIPLQEGVYRGSTSQDKDRVGLALSDGGARVGALSAQVTYACARGKSVRLPLRVLPTADKAALSSDRSFTVEVKSGSARATVAGTVSADGQSIAGTLAAKRTIAPYGHCQAAHVAWSAIRSQASAASAPSHTWHSSGPKGTSVTLTADADALTGVKLRTRLTCARGRHSLMATFPDTHAPGTLSAGGTFSFSLHHASIHARLAGALELGSDGPFGMLSLSERTPRFGLCKSGLRLWSTHS